MWTSVETLMTPYEAETDRLLEADEMQAEGRNLDSIMHLLDEGLIANAIVDSQRLTEALTDDEKVLVIAKFIEIGENESAYRMCMRWRVFRKLPQETKGFLYAAVGKETQ